MNRKLKVYIGGDLLSKGSQLLRDQEKAELKELGFDIYSPQDDKEINDKSNQTQESNNNLAERIFDKDTEAMIDADILIFEVSNNNVGTTAEIGQWAMVHRLARKSGNELIQRLANKPIFFHTTDVRDTDIPEVGYRRSHSYNQYLIGCVSECNPKGIQTWEEIEQELLTIKKYHNQGFKEAEFWKKQYESKNILHISETNMAI